MKRSAPLAVSILLLAFTAGISLAPKPEAHSEPTTEPEMQVQTLDVEMQDGSLRTMPVEDYLTGVLLAELPGSFQPEMRKAQAVVSRTYAMSRIGSTKHDSGADVCVSPACCQGWVDPDTYPDPELAERNRSAAWDTAGEVLTYEGKLIDATFFSCSGGRTEAAVEVWGTDVPYLQAVDSPGEEAPHNEDTAWFSPEDFAERLGLLLTGPPETWIGAVKETQGGGVGEMVICGQVFSGTDLRKRLGLRSTAFTLEVSESGITASTKGYGHRVGMSQYGAEAMARSGSDYREILMHYYVGTELERVN